MDVKGAIKHIEKNIATLEKEVYNFENVALVRYEADKKVLEKMRGDMRSLLVIEEKMRNREEVSIEEINNAVPRAFR